MTEMKDVKNPWGTISILIAMAFFGAIFVIGVGFILQYIYPEKSVQSCSKTNLNYCYNKEVCEKNNLFWYENECHSVEKPLPPPSEYPDLDSLSDMKSLELVKDFETFTPDGVVNSKFNKYGSFSQKGEISKGYIEIIASIDNKPLTKWESIFLRINYNSGDFRLNGGHIFRPLSLKLPPGDKTHLLYALNDIPFLESIPYDEARVPNHSNWFRYFKDGNKNDFMAFISSLSPAKIDLIKIYYKCQVGSDCDLTLSE